MKNPKKDNDEQLDEKYSKFSYFPPNAFVKALTQNAEAVINFFKKWKFKRNLISKLLIIRDCYYRNLIKHNPRKKIVYQKQISDSMCLKRHIYFTWFESIDPYKNIIEPILNFHRSKLKLDRHGELNWGELGLESLKYVDIYNHSGLLASNRHEHRAEKKSDVRFGNGYYISLKGKIYKNGVVIQALSKKNHTVQPRKCAYYLIKRLKNIGSRNGVSKEDFRPLNKQAVYAWTEVQKAKSYINKCSPGTIIEKEGTYSYNSLR